MGKIMTNLSLMIDANTALLKKELDKTNKKFGKFGKDMKRNNDKMRASFTKLAGGIVAAFGVRAIIRFGKETTRLADLQQRAQAKVSQSIKQTGGAAGMTSKELFSVAGELQKITRFGDEKILNEVTAQLLTFTNIAGDNFKRTQEIALDLATVLDGDLKSASIMLGKALNDPVKNLSLLSRSGIQFSKEQTSTIKALSETNQLAEAQTIILDELSRQYGGQAKAAVEAGAGAFIQLGNSMGDVKEIIGKKLLTALAPFATTLKEVLDSTHSYNIELMQEQNRLNFLVRAATDANISEEQRLIMIRDIQKEYPSFLGNIDAEKVSNEQLKTALDKTNVSYSKKLQLVMAQNTLNDLTKKEQKNLDKSVKLLMQKQWLENRIFQYNAQIATGVKLTAKQNSELEIAEFNLKNVNEKLDERNEKGDILAKQISDQIELTEELQKVSDADPVEVKGGITPSGTGGGDPVEETGILIDLQKDLNELKKLYHTSKTEEDMVELQKQITAKELQIKELEDRVAAKAAYEPSLLKTGTNVQGGAPANVLDSIGTDEISKTQDFIREQKTLYQEFFEWLTKEDAATNRSRTDNITDYLDAAGSAVSAISDIIQAQKQRELSAAGDNAAKRLAIEKEYFKKEKAMAIMQAVINGALAVTNMLANVPGSVINPATWVGIGIAAASTAAQVGIIASQSVPFAAGGLVYGETLATVGEYQGARTNPEVIAPLNKLQGILDNSNGGNVRFVLDGYELVGLVDKVKRKNSMV